MIDPACYGTYENNLIVLCFVQGDLSVSPVFFDGIFLGKDIVLLDEFKTGFRYGIHVADDHIGNDAVGCQKISTTVTRNDDGIFSRT